MSTSDIEFVVFVVAAFTLFGSVLGWASWEESCASRKKKKLESQADNSQSTNPKTIGDYPKEGAAQPATDERHQRHAY